MKIALMTWFHYNNYGTVLQAAALSSVLRKMGHEVDVIDYFPEETCFTLPDNSWKAQVMQRIRRRRKMINAPVVTTQISGDAFRKFREEKLTMTRFCATRSDLEQLNEEYDAFICGSDRIWMPMYFDSHFFLDFVNDPERMIAYAPSILDTGNIDEDVRTQMAALISRFIHLSVREESGRKYLDEIFSEKTQELADPTLLVEPDDWDGSLQLGGGKEEHYLLVMFQNHSAGYHDAAAKLASRLSLPIITIPIHMSDLGREGVIRDPVDPRQFVALIRNADYICTDSYHGILLSLVFQKEFCCFNQFTDRVDLPLNERTEHILNAVGLPHRLYSTDSSLEQYIKPIDYIPVNYKLDALKIKSNAFLRESLQAITEHNAAKPEEKHHVLQGYSLCSGCGACEAVCPSGAVILKTDAYGALRAEVDEQLCTRCRKCTQVCPFHGYAEGSNLVKGQLLSYRDEEQDLSEASSAGGACLRLMHVMLSAGMAVAGCVGDENGLSARHVLITPDSVEEGGAEDAAESEYTAADEKDRSGSEDAEADEKDRAGREETESDEEDGSGGAEAEETDETENKPIRVEDLCGIKYGQSSMRALWQALREYKEPAAVFAVPCQIAALKKVFEDRDNILYVDIVCSGVPSALIREKYESSKQFRKKRLRPANEVLVRMRESGLMNCEACYDCRWRGKSCADLRIGTLHDSLEKVTGKTESSVFCLTEKGREIINRLMINGYWEGLHKQDMLGYLTAHSSANPLKPAFYYRLMDTLADEKTSAVKILNDFVKPVEQKRHADGTDPGCYV